MESSSWPVVAVALLAGVLAASQVGKVIVALPTVRDDLGMSLTAAGVLLSSYTFVGALLGSAAGGFVDRLGRRRMLALALLALGAGAGLGGDRSRDTGVAVLSRFLEGLGFMASRCPLPATITAASGDRHRRFALGLWGIYMPRTVRRDPAGPVDHRRGRLAGLWASTPDCCSGARGLVVAVVPRVAGSGCVGRRETSSRVAQPGCGTDRCRLRHLLAAVPSRSSVSCPPCTHRAGGPTPLRRSSPRSSSSATSSATSFPECCCTGRTPRHADRGGRDVDGPGCRPRLCRVVAVRPVL
ncbi:MFS transporter, partial [Rhodococcus hoagii]|nr:MFS transporter [Prescottella equi]